MSSIENISLTQLTQMRDELQEWEFEDRDKKDIQRYKKIFTIEKVILLDFYSLISKMCSATEMLAFEKAKVVAIKGIIEAIQEFTEAEWELLNTQEYVLQQMIRNVSDEKEK